MPTISEIAKTAFDAVSKSIPDAIQSGELREVVTGAYDTTTATRSTYKEWRSDCRALFSTEQPVTDFFPDYIQGPGDELVFLEGLTAVPQEGWLLCTSHEYTVVRSQDVLRAGAIAWVVVRQNG